MTKDEMEEAYNHPLLKKIRKENLICSILASLLMVVILWVVLKVLAFIFSYWIAIVIVFIALAYVNYTNFSLGILEGD